MVSRGKKSDLDFKLSANPEKAISDLAKVISKQQASIVKLKEHNKAARDAQRESTKAMKAAEKGGAAAAENAGKLKNEMKGVGTVSADSLTAISAWVKGFAGISGAAAALANIKKTMAEVAAIQQTMLTDALDFQDVALKVAHVRGKTDVAGVRAAQQDIKNIALEGHVSPQVASKALFFSESSFEPESPEAMASAKTIVGFAAPAGLTPEEIQGIPKLYSAFGADTPEKQNKLLNQLVAGTGGSSAETGPYIQPLVSIANVFKEMGFSFKQTLALFTAQIEVSGTVSKAAEDTRRYVETISGRRTEKSMDFLAGEGKKDGVDFRGMTIPERVEYFGPGVYDDYAEAGNLDELAPVFGGESFKVVQLGASPTARNKYNKILPKITAAENSGHVQKMSKEYAGTLRAMNADLETQIYVSSAKRGEETAALAQIDKIADALLDQYKNRDQDWRGWMDTTFTLDGVLSHQLIGEAFQQNLGAALEQAETEEQKKRIQDLQWKVAGTNVFDADTSLQTEVYNITGGLTSVKKLGRLPYNKNNPINFGRKRNYNDVNSRHYSSVIEGFYEIGGQPSTQPATSDPNSLNSPKAIELLEEIKTTLKDQQRNTEAIERNTERRPLPAEFSHPDGGLD